MEFVRYWCFLANLTPFVFEFHLSPMCTIILFTNVLLSLILNNFNYFTLQKFNFATVPVAASNNNNNNKDNNNVAVVQH